MNFHARETNLSFLSLCVVVACAASIILCAPVSAAAPKRLDFCYVPWFGSTAAVVEPGPDREIAEAFLKSIARSGSPRLVRWPELFSKGSSGEPQLFGAQLCSFFAVALTFTEEREKMFKMIAIYPGRTMVVVPKKNEISFKDIRSLAAKRTAVVKQTTYASWLAKANETELKKNPIRIKDLKDGGAVELLNRGEIDFVLMDTIQAFYLLLKKPGQYALAFPAGENERIGWAFPKGDKLLAVQFENYLKSERLDPKSDVNKIFEKYFGLNVQEFENVVFTSFGYSK